MRERMKCKECPKDIHPERLAAIPQAVTCSRECSQKRKLRLRVEGSVRRHARLGKKLRRK